MHSKAPPPAAGALAAIAATLAAVARGCARRPRLALFAAFALALAGMGYAAIDLRPNTDSAGMISSALDYRKREIALREAFPALEDQLVVIVEADSADAADAFLARLTTEIEARPETLSEPFAASVDPFFMRNGLLYLDDADLDRTMARINRAGPLLAQLAGDPTLDGFFAGLAEGVAEADRIAGGEEALQRALVETTRVLEGRLEGAPTPLAWTRLFEADEGEVRRLLTVQPRLDYDRLQPARAALDALDSAVAAARAAPEARGVRASVTGEPALRSQELASVTEGLGLAFLVSIASVGALFWLAFHNFARALLAVGVVVVALGLAAGFAALMFDSLNLVSMAFAVLLVGLGADYAIHVLLRVEESRGAGADLSAALTDSVNDLGPALALCALTTGVGFLAFAPTAFIGMTQLGIIGAFGVLAAFAASLVMVPAGLALMRPRPLRASTAPARPEPAPPRWLAAAVSLVAVLSLAALPFVRFETDPMALRDAGSPSVIAFSSLFDDEDTRPYRVSVLASSLEEAEDLAETARGVPGVARAVTAADLIPEDIDFRRDVIDAVAIGLLPQIEAPPEPNRAQSGIDLLQAALADSVRPGESELARVLDEFETRMMEDPALAEGLAADIFTFWPLQLERLTQQLAPDYEIAPQDLPPALVNRFLAEDGRARVEITAEADLRDPAVRAPFITALSEAIPAVTGATVTLERSGQVVWASMLQAMGAAFLATALILYALTRDAPRTVATLWPVVAAALLTAAAGVAFGLPFNYANVIAFPVLIGAGVDSAIHLAARQERAHQGGQGLFASSTPRAIVFSALTTIASFGSLTLSAHRGVASIGALLAVALTATIICTLALGPAALAALERHRARTRTTRAGGPA